MTFDDILVQCQEEYAAPLGQCNTGSKPWIVLTGGEPTLQPNIAGFVKQAQEEGWRVQIETNGIIFRDLGYDVCYVISPKVSEKMGRYIHPHRNWVNFEAQPFLKFVVSADGLSPYKEIPDFAFNWLIEAPGHKAWSPTRIFVSPMNTYQRAPEKRPEGEGGEVASFWTPGLLDQVQNEKNHKWAARLCLRHGFRLNLQMHLYAALA